MITTIERVLDNTLWYWSIIVEYEVNGVICNATAKGFTSTIDRCKYDFALNSICNEE